MQDMRPSTSIAGGPPDPNTERVAEVRLGQVKRDTAQIGSL